MTAGEIENLGRKSDKNDALPASEVEPTSNPFSDIMNGLQYAVNSAQEMLQHHQIQSLARLLSDKGSHDEATGQGGKEFLSQKIKLADRVVDVPLVAMVSHHYLAMDNVEIKFKAKVGNVEAQKAEGSWGMPDGLQSNPCGQANIQMQMSGIKPDADDVMEVTVNFKVRETPEGISRIIDDLVKNI